MFWVVMYVVSQTHLTNRLISVLIVLLWVKDRQKENATKSKQPEKEEKPIVHTATSLPAQEPEKEQDPEPDVLNLSRSQRGLSQSALSFDMKVSSLSILLTVRSKGRHPCQ